MPQQESDDPMEWVKRLAESYRQVKFGRGVVGKTGQAMLGLMAVWTMIAWRWSGEIWSNGGLLIAGIVATGVFVWWVRSTQNFAERNPAQALLEGAELLEYQRFEAQAKGIPSLETTSAVEGRPPVPVSHD